MQRIENTDREDRMSTSTEDPYRIATDEEHDAAVDAAVAALPSVTLVDVEAGYARIMGGSLELGTVSLDRLRDIWVGYNSRGRRIAGVCHHRREAVELVASRYGYSA